MEYQCVVAEYEDYDKARVGLEVLDMRGFTSDQVSVITKEDAEKIGALERARREKLQETTKTSSGGLGAAMASGAALPFALGAMIGPFFVIGPVAAAVAGGIAGPLLSGAEDWGIPPAARKSYLDRLEEGSVLVIVHATGDDLMEAAAGLRTTDNLSLEQYGEKVL